MPTSYHQNKFIYITNAAIQRPGHWTGNYKMVQKVEKPKTELFAANVILSNTNISMTQHK